MNLSMLGMEIETPWWSNAWYPRILVYDEIIYGQFDSGRAPLLRVPRGALVQSVSDEILEVREINGPAYRMTIKRNS